MTTQEIRKGLRFKKTATGTAYEVTKTSRVSVWLKALSETQERKVSKTTFLSVFQSGYEKI